MKRSKFNILMALFVALILVPACGEDSNNQNPAEGEADSGIPDDTCQAGCETYCTGLDQSCIDLCVEQNCGTSEGEGEGSGMSECEQCLQACAGGTCAVSCQALCDSEDPLAAYRWFDGTWDCVVGSDCEDKPTREVYVTEFWDEEAGDAEVNGFLLRGSPIYVKKNPETGLFEINQTFGVGVGEANEQTGRFEIRNPETNAIRRVFQKR